MTPEELSRQLRRGTGEHLRQRRAVVAWSLLGATAMGPIVLYKMGLIRHLPEPPLPGLDADKVDASGEAYALLQTPDAVLGIGSYALMMGLAAAGSETRATERPWLPLALAGKVAIDVAVAAKLTVDQWTKHRAFCFWCPVGAGASFASAPLVVPEARAALPGMRS